MARYLLFITISSASRTLKGLQGTLFGRNSAAGVISVVTNEPTDDWAADAKARWGNAYEQHYEGDVLNGTLDGQPVAARVSFVEQPQQRLDAGRRHRACATSATGTMAAAPRAAALACALGHQGSASSTSTENLDQPARPAIGIVPLPPAPELKHRQSPSKPVHLDQPVHRAAAVENDVVNGVETRRFDGLTLRAEHDFGFANLTSITGWRQFSTYNREDQDGTNRQYLYFDDVNIEDNQSFSQEFTLGTRTSAGRLRRRRELLLRPTPTRTSQVEPSTPTASTRC